MHTRQVRFTSQWALVGVILFYSVGTAMIARHMHMGRIFTPTPVAAWLRQASQDGQDSATCLSGTGFQPVKNGQDARSTEDGSNLKLCGDAFGTEWSSNGSNTTQEPSLVARRTGHGSRGTSHGLTRVRTKIRYVEAILKKAVIEPYYVNGQIEGLRITCLDKILVARNLLLKSGDIIRAVNGQTLNSKRRAYEVFKRARKLPTMKVELLRDGKTKTLLYYLR